MRMSAAREGIPARHRRAGVRLGMVWVSAFMAARGIAEARPAGEGNGMGLSFPGASFSRQASLRDAAHDDHSVRGLKPHG
jgi:hypothetical protein